MSTLVVTGSGKVRAVLALAGLLSLLAVLTIGAAPARAVGGPCSQGQWYNGASCLDAQPGYYGDGTDQHKCAPGTYQPDSGQSWCRYADPGYYVPGLGATTQNPCVPPYYQPNFGATGCSTAGPGYYVDTTAATAQQPCQPGYYQPNAGGAGCLQAGPGYYVDTTAATAQQPCQPGTYQPASGQTGCLLADPGSYVDTAKGTAQQQCQPGYYQPNAGATGCLPADPGNYVDTPGATAQQPCPAGTTSTGAAVVCVPINTLFGFYDPVAPAPTVNVVKAGRTVPLKFEVFSGTVEITDTAVVTAFTVSPTSCVSGDAQEAVELTTTGGTALRYDTEAGQFVQNWKVPSGAGKCYAVTVSVTGGQSITADFMTK